MIPKALLVTVVLVLALALAPAPAWAHGDRRLVDGDVEIAAGGRVTFDGELHYHRLVGEVAADGPVRIRLVDGRSGEDVVVVGPGTRVAFNELTRCCDEAWTPHTLVLENPGETPVTATARVWLVHDDLAVMVDGAEDGTRVSIVLMGLAWWALAWRALRRRPADVPLTRPVVGASILSLVVLAPGTYAAMRYGVGGAPAVVAGNADVPILPVNPIVSRASLLMGLAMIGWAVVGLWWVRARGTEARWAWTGLGLGLAGMAVVVALASTIAYGSPLVHVAWLVASLPPIGVVMLDVSRGLPVTRSGAGEGT
ncbi:MAG TPA: hypothetical protein VK925_12785 [Jiangellaceae bacterium]|nr:hypothetical protein [Jiangellaceae bacterium]